MPPRFLFRLFPLAARVSRWLEQRFTRGGRLLSGVLVSGAILGIDISQTLAYQLAALAFALLATSLVLTMRWRPNIEVRRVLPAMITATRSTHYWLEITNHGQRLESELLLQDQLDDPPLALQQFKALRASHHALGANNWFDRAIGFPRWVALRRRQRGAELALTRLPPIAPGATVRVKLELTALRRGWLRFVGLRVFCPDALGLCRARRPILLADKLLALPRRHPMPGLRLTSARRHQTGGASLAHAVGDSQEFAALRDYAPGDPRRHIHWRSFAKTGALIVKQYQDEYFDRHALVIDTYLSDTPACFEAVIEVAASIVGSTRPRDSILDLIIAGTDVLELLVRQGRGDGQRALTYLAEATAVVGDDFAQVTAHMRSRIGRLASVILVLGRDDAARRALLDELRAHALPTLCLVVVAGQCASAGDTQEPGVHWLRVDHLAADLAALEGPR